MYEIYTLVIHQFKAAVFNQSKRPFLSLDQKLSKKVISKDNPCSSCGFAYSKKRPYQDVQGFSQIFGLCLRIFFRVDASCLKIVLFYLYLYRFIGILWEYLPFKFFAPTPSRLYATASQSQTLFFREIEFFAVICMQLVLFGA